MIEKLTEEQEALMPVYRDKWIAIGLSTEPSTDEDIKNAIGKLYSCASLVAPEVRIFDSPMAIMEYDKQVSLSDFIYGQHDAYWLSFFDYFSEVCGVEGISEKLEGLSACAAHCNWIAPYDTVCYVSRKTSSVIFDENQLLHCETGSAIKYADDFSVYSWHGVRIPKIWIEDMASVPVATIVNWENIEQRRCGCEILGWDKVLDMLGAKLIDKDESPLVGELYSTNLPDSDEEQDLFLKVHCPTDRDFFIPVPPNCKTAREANASTWGMTAEEYGFKHET